MSETNVKSIKRRMSEMSSKQRLKAVLRLLIIFLCTFGLVFQTSQLVLQYRSGQTVVNIKIETIKYNRMPAITICYPQYLSMERVLNKLPELKTQYDEYEEQLKNKSDIERKDSMFKFYSKITNFIEKSEFSIKELFNLSLPFDTINNNSSLKPINIKVKGIRLNKNGSLNEIIAEDKEPIESIVFSIDSQGYKCFTFFHHLNKKFRSYQMDVKEISIEIYHNTEWFPIEFYDSLMLYFSMHSPTSFYQQINVNNFHRLKAGKWHEMTYNRWKTILLPSPYKTNCRHYNLDDTNYHKLRSDCVNKCIQEELNKRCSQNVIKKPLASNTLSECIYRSDSLWRKDSFDSYNQNSTKFCPKYSKLSENSTIEEREVDDHKKRCINDNISHLSNECEESCRSDCLNRFYNYNVKTNIKHKLKEWDRLMSIVLAHNQLPDEITEHIAEMTFIQFICNFGGLFGMWMGLSALVILQYLLKILL